MSRCSGAKCPDVVELKCPGIVELECPGLDLELDGSCISLSACLQVRGRFPDCLCCFQ